MNNVIARTQSNTRKAIRAFGILSVSLGLFLMTGCDSNSSSGITEQSNGNSSLSKTSTTVSILGSASTFAVLGATTVTNDGASLINGDLGVSPGSAITGFQPSPINTISGPGTVTSGLGVVTGTIYAGGPIASQAHNDAVIAYNYLVAQAADTIYYGVTQLNGRTFTPGVYRFASSSNLQVNGTVTLDYQGNSDALFIFQIGSTLVTMTNSNVVAINNNNSDCTGANVYWTIGSSATLDGSQFIGNVIATTTITMASGSNVSGSVIALNGAVTMISDTVSVCNGGGTIPVEKRSDFVTGGGWINGPSNDKATFGVSGGIKHDEFWGELSYDDHSKNGVKVKSTSVTGYSVIDNVTRRIEGIAKVNGQGSFTYTVVVSDNGEPGRNDTFSLVLSNGYTASGSLIGGNIQLHTK